MRPGREHDTTCARTHPKLLPALQEWTDTEPAALADLGYAGREPAADIDQKEKEMRNLWRTTLVTGGIAVALMVGPGIGMANAAPIQLPMQEWEPQEPAEPADPPEPEPHLIVQLVEALAELELPELSL